MDGVRMVANEHVSPLAVCSHCGACDGRWDRIVSKPYCPNCEEALALGEGPALVVRTVNHRCAICHQAGSIPYLTFPLRTATPVEIHLCPAHLRGLLGRRLGQHAFHQLCRKLYSVQLGAEDVFLLHEAFYDDQGRALQPVLEPY